MTEDELAQRLRIWRDYADAMNARMWTGFGFAFVAGLAVAFAWSMPGTFIEDVAEWRHGVMWIFGLIAVAGLMTGVSGWMKAEGAKRWRRRIEAEWVADGRPPVSPHP